MDAGEKTFGIIHSAWTAGYYHWLTESLPRAYVLKERYPNAIPILPSEKYVKYASSLQLIGHKEVAFFPNESNVKLREFVLTECPPNFATTDPSLLKKVRDAILESLSVTISEPEEIVYVSRAKARGRRILNEDQLLSLLSGFGVKSVCSEDLSFSDQVQLMAKTKVLISIHGAGLTNMMFMQPNTSVCEILPIRNGIFDYNRGRNSFKHDACYVRLAEAMDLKYNCIECETDASFWQSTHMANLIVNINDFREMILALSDS